MGNIRHELWTFSKAQLSAQLATLIDFAITIIFAELIGLWYVAATLLGAISGGVANCLINYQWVFDNTCLLNKKSVALRYSLVWCGSILFNTLGTYLLTELSGRHFILAKVVVAVIIGVFWNYRLQRFFVYNSKV